MIKFTRSWDQIDQIQKDVKGSIKEWNDVSIEIDETKLTGAELIIVTKLVNSIGYS